MFDYTGKVVAVTGASSGLGKQMAEGYAEQGANLILLARRVERLEASAAEFAEKYLRQGTKMIVTGRIQTGSYTNRDGQRVYTTDVIVEDQEFAESRNASANSGGTSFSDNFRQNEAHSAPSVQDAGDGFMNIPDGVEDEGLPFN